MRLFCFSIGLLLGLNAFCQDLVPYRKNSLWGYADRNQKLMIEPQFEDAEFFINGLARVKKDGKTWLIDTKGELKTKNGYEDIFDFHNGLAAACRGGKYSWIQGEIVGGKWGYINEKFEEIIPFAYARAQDFEGDYAIVQEEENWGNWGVIDKAGRVVLPFNYPSYSFDMRPFPGLRWHYVPGQLQADVSNRGEKWKIINLKGQQIAAPKSGMHGLYKNGEDAEYEARKKAADEKIAELKKNNDMLNTPAGSIKTDGRAWCVAKGLYSVAKINDDGTVTYGIVNQKNEIIVPFEYEQINSSFTEDMIAVRKGVNWGYCSINGELTIPCKYGYVSEYKNGLTFISYKSNNRQFGGYIDIHGNEFFVSDPRLKLIGKTGHVTLTDEYENEIKVEGNPTITDARFIDDKHVLADLEHSKAVFDYSGKKIIEAPIILMLKKGRVLTEAGTITQSIDVKTATILVDSLVPENDYIQNRNVSRNGYRVYRQFPKKLYGVLSSSGETAVPFEYNEIKPNGDYFILKNEKGQYAIVDTLNRIVKPFSVDGIWGLSPQLFCVLVTAKKSYAIYDVRTKTLSNYLLRTLKEATNTSVLAGDNKKFGIVLKPYDKVIEPIYTAYTTTTFINKAGNGVRFVVMTKPDNTIDLFNAEDGKLVIAGAEEAGPHDLPMFAVKSKGKFMFYDTDGKPLSDKTYEGVRKLHTSNYIAVKSEGKWGVIDKSYQTVLDFAYTSVTDFRGNNFIAATNYNYGLIGLDKKVAIPFQYTYISYVGEQASINGYETPSVAVYLVDQEEKSALFDENNHQLTPFELEDIADSYSKGFIINKNGKPAYYDFSGKCLIEPQFDAIEIFDISDPEGRDLFRVRTGKKYGLYNDLGQVLLPCEYNEFSGSDEYYYQNVIFIMLEKDGKKGMFGNNGKMAIPVIYSDIKIAVADDNAFIEVRRDGRAGLYKNYTRKLTEAEFDGFELYEDNLYMYYIPVKQKGLLGVLDTSGKMVAQPQYTKLELEEISDGYVFMTSIGKRKGLMRLNGEELLMPQFSNIEISSDFDKTAYLVTLGKNYGLFDINGKMVVPCNAVKVDNYVEDYADHSFVLAFTMQDGKYIGVTSDLQTIEIKRE